MDHIILDFEADLSSIELAKLTQLTLEIAGFQGVFFIEEGPGGGNPCVGCKVPKDKIEKLREVLTKTFAFFGCKDGFTLILEDDQIIME